MALAEPFYFVSTLKLVNMWQDHKRKKKREKEFSNFWSSVSKITVKMTGGSLGCTASPSTDIKKGKKMRRMMIGHLVVVLLNGCERSGFYVSLGRGRVSPVLVVVRLVVPVGRFREQCRGADGGEDWLGRDRRRLSVRRGHVWAGRVRSELESAQGLCRRAEIW
jgi:hypothetical protein